MYGDMHAIAVDDNEVNLMLIESMAQSIDLPVKLFQDPMKANDYAKNHLLDIAFIDYQMPDLNGIQLTHMIRGYHPEIPIIMISAINDADNLKLDALEAGVTEFIIKPIKTYEFRARVKNLLQLRRYQLLYQDKAKVLEAEVAKTIKEVTSREYETLTVLGRASEYKDTETSNHIKRVASYARLLSEKLGKSATFQETIFHASPLHDLGKIGTPDHILLKSGRLTDEEFNEIKKHPEIGYDILKDSKSLYLQAGAIIARSHHERYDGSGYPHGLKRSQIDMMGRIIAVADVFDALISKRPYKKPWPFKMAVKEIRDNSGTHFDPEVVHSFLQNLVGIKAIVDQFKD